MKILRDPIWQFVAVIVALLSISIAVYLVFSNRESKNLQIELLSNSPLVSIQGDVSKDIKVIYKDKPVQTMSAILLRVENAGNTPIKESDYSKPVLFSISPNAEIVQVDIIETSPPGVDISALKTNSNQIELSKSLLNPGDQAVLKILAINNDDTLQVSARIGMCQ